MPFDGVNAGLADRLSWLGIVPVPENVLEAHKVAEAAKYPDEQARWQIGIIGFSIIVGCAVWYLAVFQTGLTLLNVMLATTISFWSFWLTGAALTACLWNMKVKGPAVWRERRYSGQPIPEPIWTLAREAQRQIPRSRLVIGELTQNRVVLDPYLMLYTQYDEKACLGIWDGDTVIAKADRR